MKTRYGTFYCHDCGFDTHKGNEYYAVYNSLWRKYGKGTMLCLGCLAKRIGRPLNRDDFKKDVPVNTDPRFKRSKRFMKALNRKGR